MPLMMKRRVVLLINYSFSDKRYDLGEVGRYKINRKLNLNQPLDHKTLTKEDMIEIIKYLVRLTNAKAEMWTILIT